MIEVDEAVRYPIGLFTYDPESNDARRRSWIDALRRLPSELEEAVDGISDDALERSYREGGWTARQLVHHIADGHMNIYIRFKLAMTEDVPEIKPFDENTWVNTPEMNGPIEESLDIIRGVHARWVRLLDALSPGDFERAVMHPISGLVTLDRMLQYFAWHGMHHVAHIRAIRK
jgi:uncharacterized damage-inducible protein DinB